MAISLLLSRLAMKMTSAHGMNLNLDGIDEGSETQLQIKTTTESSEGTRSEN